jgi:uncharacterized membrane protein YfcA
MAVSEAPPRVNILALIAAGASAGVLSGLLGVGGGLVMVPALVLLGVAQHRAHATSLAAIVPIGIVGAIVFGQAGSVDVLAAAVLVGGSLLGVQAGARAMNRLSAERLALVFAGFVLLVALAMLFL